MKQYFFKKQYLILGLFAMTAFVGFAFKPAMSDSICPSIVMETAFSDASRNTGTTFTIDESVVLPVSVKINGGGIIEISQRSYTTSTSIPNVTYIRDAYGKNCHYKHSSEYISGRGTYHYYEVY